MSVREEWLRQARDCVGDAICTHLRDNSRPLSAWIVDALVEAGFLLPPDADLSDEALAALVATLKGQIAAYEQTSGRAP